MAATMNMYLLLSVGFIILLIMLQSITAQAKVLHYENSAAEHHHKRHHRQSGPNMWKILEKNDHHQQLEAHGSSRQSTHSKEKLSSGCTKCHHRDALMMTEQELTDLRIEFVKNQILKKLKLKQRPQVTMSSVPRPVAEGATIQVDENDENSLTGIPDEYYARTTQKIIFPQLDSETCQEAEILGSSMCFSMQIPADIEHEDVESAELWVYKQPHIMNQSVDFLIGEIDTWKAKRVLRPFAIQDTNDTEVWVKIDVAAKIRQWIEQEDLTHVIDITCNTCEHHPSQGLLSLDNDYRPFIVVNTFSNRKQKRQRRSINCSSGVNECCREKLYISFKEIGWSDWILHPPGYDAYFCRGSCASAATITISGSNYISVIRKVMYQQSGSRNKLELVPCCTATQFSSLQLFYMDSNNTATQKTLPNMVVEACGCM